MSEEISFNFLSKAEFLALPTEKRFQYLKERELVSPSHPRREMSVEESLEHHRKVLSEWDGSDPWSDLSTIEKQIVKLYKSKLQVNTPVSEMRDLMLKVNDLHEKYPGFHIGCVPSTHLTLVQGNTPRKVEPSGDPERQKKLFWESLMPVQRLNILIYLYKFESQTTEELDQSLEARNYRSYKITRDQLPLAILSLRGASLMKAAYGSVGLPWETSEPAPKRFFWDTDEGRSRTPLGPFFFKTEEDLKRDEIKRRIWLEKHPVKLTVTKTPNICSDCKEPIFTDSISFWCSCVQKCGREAK